MTLLKKVIFTSALLLTTAMQTALASAEIPNDVATKQLIREIGEAWDKVRFSDTAVEFKEITPSNDIALSLQEMGAAKTINGEDVSKLLNRIGSWRNRFPTQFHNITMKMADGTADSEMLTRLRNTLKLSFGMPLPPGAETILDAKPSSVEEAGEFAFREYLKMLRKATKLSEMVDL